MSRQHERIARQREAEVEAERIVAEAVDRAWERVTSHEAPPLTCAFALSTPVLGRPFVPPSDVPESP